MAQRTTVELVDDVDGGAAAESVTFGLDGVSYEIDLSAENAAKLRESLSSWVERSRRVAGRKQRGTGGASASGGKSDAALVREWARSHDLEVPDRGRIPANVRRAYDAGDPALAESTDVPDDASADAKSSDDEKSSSSKSSAKSSSKGDDASEPDGSDA